MTGSGPWGARTGGPTSQSGSCAQGRTQEGRAYCARTPVSPPGVKRVSSFGTGGCRIATELEWIAEFGESPSSHGGVQPARGSCVPSRGHVHAVSAALCALPTHWSQVRGQMRCGPSDQPQILRNWRARGGDRSRSWITPTPPDTGRPCSHCSNPLMISHRVHLVEVLEVEGRPGLPAAISGGGGGRDQAQGVVPLTVGSRPAHHTPSPRTGGRTPRGDFCTVCKRLRARTRRLQVR